MPPIQITTISETVISKTPERGGFYKLELCTKRPHPARNVFGSSAVAANVV